MTRAAGIHRGLVVAIKAVGDRPGWDPQMHPRDRRGRFIETGARVDLFGGGSGAVARVLPGGRVEVDRDDGRTVTVDQGYLTVTARPDGTSPDTQDDDRDVPAPTGRRGTRSAANASPTRAYIYFENQQGESAWLEFDARAKGGVAGYLRTADTDPAGTVAYDDLDRWERETSARGMTEQPVPSEDPAVEAGAEQEPPPTSPDGGPEPVPEGEVERPPPEPPPPAPEPSAQAGAFTAANVTGNVARLRIGSEFRARPTNSTGADKYRRYRVRRVEGNDLVGEARLSGDGRWVDDQGQVHATRDEALAAVANRAEGGVQPELEPAPEPTPPVPEEPPPTPPEPEFAPDPASRSLTTSERRRARAISQRLTAYERELYSEGLTLVRQMVPHDPTVNQVRTHLSMVGRGSDRTVGAGVVAQMFPEASEQERRDLETQVEPLLAAYRTRVGRVIGDRIEQRVPPSVPKGIRGDRILRAVADLRTGPPVGDARPVGEALMRARDALRPREADDPLPPPPPEIPTPDPETDLATRLAVYRAALPDDMANFADRRKRFTALTGLDPTSLEAGTLPRREVEERWVWDRAGDGGPGEWTMRNLAVLQAAGADLDRDLQRRMGPVLADQQEAQRRLTRAKERNRQANEAVLAARREVERRVARDDYGYDSTAAMRDAADAAETAGDRDREAELRSALSEIRGIVTGRIPREREEQAAAQEELRKAQSALKRLRADVGVPQRKAAMELVAEHRQMGGTQLTYQRAGGTTDTQLDELTAAMRYAEQVYPAEWLDLAKTKYGSRGLKLGKNRRGYFAVGQKEIMLSPERTKAPGGGGTLGRTATHELGHVMEIAVPGLGSAQKALLWSRTSTGEVGSRVREETTQIAGYGTDERGWRDEFPDHYTGKDYPDGGGYEVLTTSMESLMAGSAYLDEGLRVWLLGTLTLL